MGLSQLTARCWPPRLGNQGASTTIRSLSDKPRIRYGNLIYTTEWRLCPSHQGAIHYAAVLLPMDDCLDEFDVTVSVSSIGGSTMVFSMDIDDSSFG